MIEVNIYGTKITVNRGELPHMWEKEGNKHWENFIDMLHFLSSIGFYVGEDKQIKKEYPILNDDHREGRYADLKFKAKYAANMFRIEFYQDVVFENPNGGYYDFNKLEKMPYLIRKQYELIQRKLVSYFESRDYKVVFKNNKKGADFIVENYIQSWHHPQEEPFDLSEVDGQVPEHSNNYKDRDKHIVHNGDIKYFRDWDGYLKRGKVYHNINNMWWVLCGGEVRNICCSSLFDLSDKDYRGRQKKHTPPQDYVERRKQLSLCSIKELQNELRRRSNE